MACEVVALMALVTLKMRMMELVVLARPRTVRELATVKSRVAAGTLAMETFVVVGVVEKAEVTVTWREGVAMGTYLVGSLDHPTWACSSSWGVEVGRGATKKEKGGGLCWWRIVSSSMITTSAALEGRTEADPSTKPCSMP